MHAHKQTDRFGGQTPPPPARAPGLLATRAALTPNDTRCGTRCQKSARVCDGFTTIGERQLLPPAAGIHEGIRFKSTGPRIVRYLSQSVRNGSRITCSIDMAVMLNDTLCSIDMAVMLKDIPVGGKKRERQQKNQSAWNSHHTQRQLSSSAAQLSSAQDAFYDRGSTFPLKTFLNDGVP